MVYAVKNSTFGANFKAEAHAPGADCPQRAALAWDGRRAASAGVAGFPVPTRAAVTEDQARTALAAFDGTGGLERWIAAQPWLAAPGGWVVPEPFQGWRFRVEVAPGGVRVRAFMDNGEPAAWIVPAR